MDGKYYIIGEGHKGFVADKVTDDDNYVLTMAAVVKELEARGYTDTRNNVRVHLAVGLPLKWVQAQREEFKAYMLKNRNVKVGYKQRMYELEITGCTVMPQCYSAVAENLKDFKGMNLVVDIGNGTMNLMYLNNGRAMESRSWTEKLGVFQCEINIRNKVRDNTGNELMREVIDNFLRTGETDIVEPYASLMKEAATEYADIVFQKLYDYEYNEQMMKLHFIGGGTRII
jgi:plasmid segregation protein ParM